MLALVPMFLYITQVGEEMPSIPLILLLICPILLVAFGAAYIDLFLRSFVVPIMYKERLKTNAAWRRFAPVLKARLGWFLLYGIWLLVLMIGVVFAVLILVLVTCCLAGILLVIPYIGTVLLLPLYVGLRALSLEFLAQFGDEFKLFPEPQPAAGDGRRRSRRTAAARTTAGSGTAIGHLRARDLGLARYESLGRSPRSAHPMCGRTRSSCSLLVVDRPRACRASGRALIASREDIPAALRSVMRFKQKHTFSR